jgi:hypothetical protein
VGLLWALAALGVRPWPGTVLRLLGLAADHAAAGQLSEQV